MCIQGKRMEADLEAMPTRGRIIHWELGDGCQGDCEPEDAEAQPGSRVARLQECAPIGTHCLTAAESARSQAQRQRSVPAGAGEPIRTAPRSGTASVCPRGCGGTDSDGSEVWHGFGLSPRVRGNPCGCWRTASSRRSIPAGAGEPDSRFCQPACHAVYPRGCGGTRPLSVQIGPALGLSPRVRGNLHHGRAQGGQPRSIPAGAGEPSSTRWRS